MTHRLAGGLPAFHGLVNNYGRVGNGDPEADLFDGKFSPCGDANPKHLLVAKVPPAVGYGKCDLPHKADEENKESCEAEGAPVDDGSCRWEQSR